VLPRDGELIRSPRFIPLAQGVYEDRYVGKAVVVIGFSLKFYLSARHDSVRPIPSASASPAGAWMCSHLRDMNPCTVHKSRHLVEKDRLTDWDL
jgi:hypothetical protein